MEVHANAAFGAPEPTAGGTAVCRRALRNCAPGAGCSTASPGIAVKRLMRDKAFAYAKNRSLREVLADTGIGHLLTQSYRPQTNGEVERFRQTMAREWAYVMSYRSHRHRNRALPHWLPHYTRDQAPQLTRWPAAAQPRSQHPWAGTA